jgi:hypothetical protein
MTGASVFHSLRERVRERDPIVVADRIRDASVRPAFAGATLKAETREIDVKLAAAGWAVQDKQCINGFYPR